MAKLCAYIRVSSEGQRENTSMELQRERIAAYCASQGHELVAVFWDVQSASGRKARKGFKQALDFIYAQCDGLICMKLDRFARNTLEGLDIAASLRQADKQLVLLDLNLDTSTPIGQCIFTVLLAFAQLERDTIQDRCDSGREQKKLKNEYLCGRPPYGYKAHKGDLVAVPEQMVWRNKILSWYAEGHGWSWMMHTLNRLNVPSQQNKRWTPNAIRQIIMHRSVLIEWYDNREQQREREEQVS